MDLGGNIFVLPAGTVVDNTQTYFNPGGSVDVGLQVALNAANYFGVEFDNEDTGEVNYAWLEITFGDTAGERSITRFVYDNMGNEEEWCLGERICVAKNPVDRLGFGRLEVY